MEEITASNNRKEIAIFQVKSGVTNRGAGSIDYGRDISQWIIVIIANYDGH